MSVKLSPDLQEFIARHIASVEHLDVLLLLCRYQNRTWNPTEINRELRGSEHSIAHWLGLLVASGLAVAVDDGHRFQPATDETRRLAELLASTYRERPVPVIEFIYSRPNPQLLAFSQAFKLRNRS